jgi:hypothetical protein
MEIYVLSRGQFDHEMKRNGINDDTVEGFEDIIFISILSTIDMPHSIHHLPVFKKPHPNTLTEKFDDVFNIENEAVFLTGDPDKPISTGMGIRINEEQSDRIASFVHLNRDKKVALIHCAAGISRSGAVGAFINDIMGQSYLKFKEENMRVQENGEVYRMLHKSYNRIVGSES